MLGSLLPSGAFFGAEGCHDATGGVAGGQIGYRWQTSPWVFGVEAQGDWADLQRLQRQPVLLPAITNSSKIDAFGLFTGQIGYAWNNVLVYVKGGAAVTADRFSVSTTAGNVLAGVDRRSNPLGWHGRCRPRIRLRAELVGRRRIRSSVHAGQEHDVHRSGGRFPARAATASARTSIWSPCASTTAGAAR